MKNTILTSLLIAATLCLTTNCKHENKTTGNITSIENFATSSEDSVYQDRASIYNLIIVDESGSMMYLTEAVQAGLDSTFSIIQKASMNYDTSQIHFLSLVFFGTQYELNLKEVIPMTTLNNIPEHIEYLPEGGTPLYDAIGVTVNKLYNQIKNNDNAVGVVTIVSDGMENSSKQYNSRQIKELVGKLTEEGWSFAYMGSAHDVKRAAREIGIKNTLEFDHSLDGTQDAYKKDGAAKNRYYYDVNKNWAKEKNLSKEEKQALKRQRANEYFSEENN